jgi:hypothetical protein
VSRRCLSAPMVPVRGMSEVGLRTPTARRLRLRSASKRRPTDMSGVGGPKSPKCHPEWRVRPWPPRCRRTVPPCRRRPTSRKLPLLKAERPAGSRPLEVLIEYVAAADRQVPRYGREAVGGSLGRRGLLRRASRVPAAAFDRPDEDGRARVGRASDQRGRRIHSPVGAEASGPRLAARFRPAERVLTLA